MGEITTTAEQAGDNVENSEWFDKAIRVGFVAYGVVTLLIAWLALQLAFGDQEGKASSQGAMQQLAEEPGGTVLLWLVALGMFALVRLEAARRLRSATRRRTATRSVAQAGGFDVLKAVLYAVIGIAAIRRPTGRQRWLGGKSGTDSLTAKIMDLPGGQVLVVPGRARDHRLRRQPDPRSPTPRSSARRSTRRRHRAAAVGPGLLSTSARSATPPRASRSASSAACSSTPAFTHDAKKSGGLDAGAARGPRAAVRPVPARR